MFQKPGVRSFHVSRVKIKDCTNRCDKLHVQFILVPMYPFFLFRRRHPHPEDIRCGPVDSGYHRPVLLFGEDFLEWRGINPGVPDAREFLCHSPLYGGQRRFGGSQKEIAGPSPAIEPAAQLSEDVAPCNPFPYAAAQNTGRQHDPYTVRDQYVGPFQSFHGFLVRHSRTYGMRIQAGQAERYRKNSRIHAIHYELRALIQ